MLGWLKRRLARWLLGYIIEEGLPYIKIGDNSVIIDGSSIRLPRLSSDPSLATGKIWLRDDNYIKYSPDGSTIESLSRASDLESHKNAKPIDHPTGSVTRDHLETVYDYVTLGYLIAKQIGYNLVELIPQGGSIPNAWGLVTVKSFDNKSIKGSVKSYANNTGYLARYRDPRNWYFSYIRVNLSTSDHRLSKSVNGSVTNLATEAIDLSTYRHTLMIGCKGSTIDSWRDEPEEPQLSVTDTSFASGKFGGIASHSEYNDYVELYNALLRDYYCPRPKPIALLELEVEGSGKPEDPFRPAFLSDERNGRDYLSVTWGSFEFHPEKDSSVLVAIYRNNPYNNKALELQRENARSWYRPPRDYGEAVGLYKKLSGGFAGWLAGKDDFVKHSLGLDVAEFFALADFYYGELVEHQTHKQQLREVSENEINRSLERLEDALSRINVLTEERDKHINKVKKVKKLGW